MIRAEKLADALERLPPRDSELLALSLRRRVPDEALARLYDCGPGDVARRRAAAIERLADELGVQRGEDLGAVLKALLEPDVWDAVEAGGAASTLGAEFEPPRARTPLPPTEAVEAVEPRVYRIRPSAPAEGRGGAAVTWGGGTEAVGDGGEDEGEGAPAEDGQQAADGSTTGVADLESKEAGAAAEDWEQAADGSSTGVADLESEEAGAAPEDLADNGDAADRSRVDAAGSAGVATVAADPGDAVSGAAAFATARPDAADDDGSSHELPAAPQAPHEPVLEMLADGQATDPGARRSVSVLAIAGFAVAALAAAAGFLGARQLGEDSASSATGGGDGTRHFIPQELGPLGATPFPSEPQHASCYPTAYVRQAAVLYTEPGGRKLLRIAARTEWRSPRVMGVVRQRPGWLAVLAPELANGEVGWIPRAGARVDCVRWSLHADLSRRILYVRRDGHTVRKLRVAVGRRGNPTPTGRFAVTDKLKVQDRKSPYGCCVLALTGHQSRLPPDWPGGDRLAVHATTDRSSIGKPVSLGCLRTTAGRARWLIETMPLGTPMFIRA